MIRTLFFLIAIFAVVSSVRAENALSPLQDMYIRSFGDPVGFARYIEANRQSLANPYVAKCLEDIGALSDDVSTQIDECLVKGDINYALVCLNENPRQGVKVWARSFYDSVFRKIPWIETAMGRTAKYNQFVNEGSNVRQNMYLLQRSAKFLQCQ